MMPDARPQVLEAPSSHEPSRLLLVDDTMEDLIYYTAILEHLGYEVRPCPSYVEGANFFDVEHFDLVIVNQGGNAFEGRQVLARAIEADRHMPVLVLTHSPSLACYVEAMQLGAFDYVQKPLRASEVAELVGRHVRGAVPSPVAPSAEPSKGEWPFGRTRIAREN